MSFFNQFNDIANAKGGGGSNGGYEDRPGWYLCTIKEVNVSPDNHPGAPYIEFKMRTEEDKMITAKLWVARPSDAEKTQANKNKRIKEFFEDAGVSLSNGPEEAIKEIVGKQLNCAFQQREYVGKDRDQGDKPVIRTVLNFYYSKKVGDKYEPLNESNSVQRLSKSDEMKYQQTMTMWEKQNAAKNPQRTEVDAEREASVEQEDDELPF